MTQVEIIVLANSVKHGKHCVAGKCLSTRRWIRPVSNEQGAELDDEQVRYQNPYGTYGVKTLQKIRMEFSKHVPLPHQPENFLIDGSLWKQNYSIEVDKLLDYLDNPTNLWGEGSKVEHVQIRSGLYNITQSLYLVQVERLNLYRTDKGKRRAKFTYNDLDYELAVTDPRFDDIVDKQHEVKGILCVSLGEEFQGYCYKLVATIF